MYTKDGISIFGNADDNTIEQMVNCKKHPAIGAALMADNHLGYSQPIGGVVVYKDHISPSGIGYDIGCGNKAVRLESSSECDYIKEIMDEVYRKIAFGMGRTNEFADSVPELPDIWNHDAWNIPAIAPLKEMARQQLGTVGGGNHYVDVFVDEFGYMWVGVHFGSRGLGHKIATHYVKMGGGKQDMMAEPVLFHVEQPLGQEYLLAMDLAGKYAYAGRDWVCSKVAEIIGCPIIEEVHNHHNYAWKENHYFYGINGLENQDVWVVRKGATPNAPGQMGFIGGSMCDISVITKGKRNIQAASMYDDESTMSFNSTVHGAGRIMSRTQAKGKYKKGKQIIRGKVSQQMMDDAVALSGIELRGGGLDETPYCYKDIGEVLGHHKDTLEIVHTLTPIGVAMADDSTKDPYVD